MRTTVRSGDDLLKQAMKRAADAGRTLASLMEDALTLIVYKPKTRQQERVEIQASKASGGVLQGIDLNRSSDLEEVMNTS